MTTPNDLTALAARMQEAQAEEQREWLIEAAKVLQPEWYEMSKPVEAIIAFTKWCRMLEAEAFESAALMLVPERHRWSLHAKASGSLPFSYSAEICSRRTGLEKPTYSYPCSTPALAIASAALLAHVENSHD